MTTKILVNIMNDEHQVNHVLYYCLFHVKLIYFKVQCTIKSVHVFLRKWLSLIRHMSLYLFYNAFLVTRLQMKM